NFFATFTPQKQLTPDQIFWSQDLIKMKSEALKEQTTVSRPIKALTMYPPHTPATLVPRVLPTKSQECCLELEAELSNLRDKSHNNNHDELVNRFSNLEEHFKGIQKDLTKEINEMKDIFEELETKVAKNVVDRKHDDIERKNLLIANDNLIAECLSKEVFSVATNFELHLARFTEMHVANTIVEECCLELEAELSNLRDKSHNNNHDELVNRFSNLEVNHLNLQLKYQNLKDSFGNNSPTHDKDTPDFDSIFVIGKGLQNLHGHLIVSIRTYHDREFDNEIQFGVFYDKHEISHNFSAPRTPQSNGIVERKNQTLQEINENFIPQRFWSYTVETAAYIFNKVLIRNTINKTPYEILRGRNPLL
nr:hypothetical protein [Tanacetum cinerariifolium]